MPHWSHCIPSFSLLLLHNSNLLQQIGVCMSPHQSRRTCFRWAELQLNVLPKARGVFVPQGLGVAQRFQHRDGIQDLSFHLGHGRLGTAGTSQGQEAHHKLRGFCLPCTAFTRDQDSLPQGTMPNSLVRSFGDLVDVGFFSLSIFAFFVTWWRPGVVFLFIRSLFDVCVEPLRSIQFWQRFEWVDSKQHRASEGVDAITAKSKLQCMEHSWFMQERQLSQIMQL